MQVRNIDGQVSTPHGQMAVFDEQVSGGQKKMAGGQVSGGQMSIIQCVYKCCLFETGKVLHGVFGPDVVFRICPRVYSTQ